MFTKSALAGKVVKVTSQRELTQFFGNPTFTKSGTAVVQGSETSEYGLMAAYSYLGQGNQAYIVRADLSLGQLEATTTAPTSAYATANGSEIIIHALTEPAAASKIAVLSTKLASAGAPITATTLSYSSGLASSIM